MKTAEAKKFKDVIIALGEGKIIETRIGNSWVEVTNPMFVLHADYRIKPNQ